LTLLCLKTARVVFNASLHQSSPRDPIPNERIQSGGKRNAPNKRQQALGKKLIISQNANAINVYLQSTVFEMAADASIVKCSVGCGSPMSEVQLLHSGLVDDHLSQPL